MSIDTEDLKPFRFDKLREGDTCHSRTTRTHGTVIAYAEVWKPGRAGRKAARAAVKDPTIPNHSFNAHESWGQKFPVEAGPKGYARGDFDEYRTKDTWIVGVYRWKGFDDPAKRELCARTLEYWIRKGHHVEYDWSGAPLSTRFGRAILLSPVMRVLFPKWTKERADRLYCSEGVKFVLIVCGILGEVLAFDTDLAVIRALAAKHSDKLPLSDNPLDLMRWQQAHPEFEGIAGVYGE